MTKTDDFHFHWLISREIPTVGRHTKCLGDSVGDFVGMTEVHRTVGGGAEGNRDEEIPGRYAADDRPAIYF